MGIGPAAVIEIQPVSHADRVAGAHLGVELLPAAARAVRDQGLLRAGQRPVFAITADGEVRLERVAVGFLPLDGDGAQVQALVAESLHVIKVFPPGFTGLENDLQGGPLPEVPAERDGAADLIVQRAGKEHPAPAVHVVHDAARISGVPEQRLAVVEPLYAVRGPGAVGAAKSVVIGPEQTAIAAGGIGRPRVTNRCEALIETSMSFRAHHHVVLSVPLTVRHQIKPGINPADAVL